MIRLEDITWIHAELSTLCQAACPLCARNDYGFKTRTDFPKCELTIEDWAKIFDNSNMNPNRFYFNGNFGDPIIAKDIVEITEYCFNRWPRIKIEISTNGGIRSEEWWSEFAIKFKKNNLIVDFCIDGLEDTNHIYRINVPYEKAIGNAKAFIAAGGRAYWRMIKFKHNEHQFEEAKHRSKEIGFNAFLVTDDGRNRGFTFINEIDGYWILPSENSTSDQSPQMIRPKVFESKPPKIKDDGLIPKLESKWLANDKNIDCFVKKEQSLYLAANGEVYPCCFIGFFPKEYKGWYTNFNEVVGDITNNAIIHGLEKSIEYFNKVEDSWSKESVAEGVITTCLNCSKEWRSTVKKFN
jgi:sulfatase maturation enzyme AslB (radical SAM superfamily)